MMKILLFLMMIMPLSVSANHPWVDIDLCEVYKNKLPPGLTLESLPEAHSPGAILLNQYCIQCHNLPDPNRHTKAEWSAVTEKMFHLMKALSRFRGLPVRIDNIQSQDKKILLSYLQRHASSSTVNKNSADDHPWRTRTLALLPFLLLTGLGLVRWWYHSRRDHKPCTTD